MREYNPYMIPIYPYSLLRTRNPSRELPKIARVSRSKREDKFIGGTIIEDFIETSMAEHQIIVAAPGKPASRI